MVYTHTISLTPHVSIEVPVRRQESERSGICVLEISFLTFSTIFQFHVGTLRTIKYILLILLINKGNNKIIKLRTILQRESQNS